MDSLKAGTTLGHYTVLRSIGAGGMGIVYEAEDLRLGRHVALKLIGGASAADSTALDRFYREARIASSLNHPGICTIYEIDEGAGQPFLAMELLDGQPLDRLYAGHAAPLQRLTEIATQLADALDAAHRKGILHRDIKPANIFITTSGQAKILDFGLARIENAITDTTQSGAISESDKLTRSGSTLGTVAYMSPEQARGESLDARSDLFSLGVVLYEMATGNHPFSGTTSAVVFDKLLNYNPPSATSLNRDLPPEFETLLNKALEKDRELRYQSASDLRADLRRLQRSSSGIHVTATSMPPAASYPGMTRVGSAQPVPASDPSATPAPLKVVSPPPARRLFPAWLLVGLAALIVAASAVAGVRYFARRHAAQTTTAAAAPAPSGTTPAAHPLASTAPKTAATVVPPPATSAPAPAAAKPSAAPAKPSAEIPKTTTPAPAQPSEPAPVQSPASASSFEADAGASAAHPVFRRAFVAAPSFEAHHMHFFGSFCSGTLQFKPETLSFTSPTHSFTLTRDQIRGIEHDTIVETSGRHWRLEIPGRTAPQVHFLLARWFDALPAPQPNH